MATAAHARNSSGAHDGSGGGTPVMLRGSLVSSSLSNRSRAVSSELSIIAAFPSAGPSPLKRDTHRCLQKSSFRGQSLATGTKTDELLPLTPLILSKFQGKTTRCFESGQGEWNMT